jgi:predicted nucleotidyltransferase
MIEVRLLENEQPHPAMDNTGWFGKRGDFWRMDKVENMTEEQSITLKDAITEWLTLCEEHYGEHLIDLIKDYEICGSYAFGNFHWWSDMDIQLSTEERETQDRIARIFLSDFGFFKTSTWDLSHRLKIHFDINFWHPNNKSYNTVYSLRDKRLYCQPDRPEIPQDGLVVPDSFHRKYDKETGKYEVQVRTRPQFFDSIYWDSNGNLLDWKR